MANKLFEHIGKIPFWMFVFILISGVRFIKNEIKNTNRKDTPPYRTPMQPTIFNEEISINSVLNTRLEEAPANSLNEAMERIYNTWKKSNSSLTIENCSAQFICNLDHGDQSVRVYENATEILVAESFSSAVVSPPSISVRLKAIDGHDWLGNGKYTVRISSTEASRPYFERIGVAFSNGAAEIGYESMRYESMRSISD